MDCSPKFRKDIPSVDGSTGRQWQCAGAARQLDTQPEVEVARRRQGDNQPLEGEADDRDPLLLEDATEWQPCWAAEDIATAGSYKNARPEEDKRKAGIAFVYMVSEGLKAQFQLVASSHIQNK